MAEITKVVFTGSEGAGKSYEMAKTAWSVLHRNAKLIKKGYPPRSIVTNMQFSKSYHLLAEKFKVPIVQYHTLSQLIENEECDVFMDEISKYFDSHRWQDLSVEALTWITQGGKRGIKMYASCQDFSQVAKSFRVITSRVFLVSKIMGSKRPSKTMGSPWFVWGFIAVWRVNPKSFKGDDVTMETIGFLPQIFRIKRKYTSIFNTSQKIIRPEAMPLEHISRYCEICGKVEVKHR